MRFNQRLRSFPSGMEQSRRPALQGKTVEERNVSLRRSGIFQRLSFHLSFHRLAIRLFLRKQSVCEADLFFKRPFGVAENRRSEAKHSDQFAFLISGFLVNADGIARSVVPTNGDGASPMDCRWCPWAPAGRSVYLSTPIGVAESRKFANNFGWEQNSCLKPHRPVLGEWRRDRFSLEENVFFHGFLVKSRKWAFNSNGCRQPTGGNCFLRAVTICSAIDNIGSV